MKLQSVFLSCFLIAIQSRADASVMFPEVEHNTKEVFQQFDVKREAAIESLKSHPTWEATFSSMLEAQKKRLEKSNRSSAIFYGTYAYSSTRNDENPMGILKRVKKDLYLKAKVEDKFDELQWDVWLNFDEVVGKVRIDGFIDMPDVAGLDCYFNPVTKERERCLIKVNQSGGDKFVFYEYDIEAKSLVKDGFNLEVFGSHSVSWINSDTISLRLDRVAWHNFNNPEDQIEMGPEAVKRGFVTEAMGIKNSYLWRRGEKFQPVHPVVSAEGDEQFSWTGGGLRQHGKEDELDVLIVGTTVSRNEYRIFYATDFDGDGEYTKPTRIEVPDKMTSFGQMYDGLMLFMIDEDWKSFKNRDIIGIKITKEGQSVQVGKPQLVYSPKEDEFIDSVMVLSETLAFEDDYLVFLTMKNVDHVVKTMRRSGEYTWEPEQVVDFPGYSKHLTANFLTRNEFLRISVESFTSPSTTFEVRYRDGKLVFEKFDQGIESFDSKKYKTTQLWIDRGVDPKTRRKVRVPYYVVYNPETVSLEQNKTPQKTIVNAYGGHGMRGGPQYLGARLGQLWLDQGGVYVWANVRGGGAFGNWWYEMSRNEGQKARTDDFNAVTKDLIARGIAVPETLGAFGGSNGGLLMGQVVTQRPDLYAAVQINIPLLDMMRFPKIGDERAKGYINEWGDPDGAQRDFWLKYSPLHALKPNVDYPNIMLYSARFDDRTHPAHTRKFSLRLDELNVKHEMVEWPTGGHGGASATLAETIEPMALKTVFFHKYLGVNSIKK